MVDKADKNNHGGDYVYCSDVAERGKQAYIIWQHAECGGLSAKLACDIE